MWPEGPRPSRVLRSTLDAARALPMVRSAGCRWAPTWSTCRRFAIVPPTAAFQGRIEAMALYAGDGVGAVQAIAPAAQVVDRVVAKADELLA